MQYLLVTCSGKCDFDFPALHAASNELVGGDSVRVLHFSTMAGTGDSSCRRRNWGDVEFVTAGSLASDQSMRKLCLMVDAKQRPVGRQENHREKCAARRFLFVISRS